MGEIAEFSPKDFCPFLIFKSEYLYIQSIRDLYERDNKAAGVIGQIALPQLALIAYETSQWVEKKTSEELYSKASRQLLARKRHLFKYFDDISYTVDQFDEHCTAVLKASRAMFKQGAGSLSFLQKDAGIYMLDGIEVGSTFTTFRYLYDDLLENDGRVDYSGINDRAGEVGYLIGQHAACLMGLMAHFDQDDLTVRYRLPVLKEPADDFFFSDIKASIIKDKTGKVSDGLLVILADAYYSLGYIKVLNGCNMFDDLLTVKFNLLTLHHLESVIKKILAFSYRKEKPALISGCFESDLKKLIAAEDRRFLRRCRPIRNVLVHYELEADAEVRGDSLQEIAESILGFLASSVDLSWPEMTEQVNAIAHKVRLNLGEVFCMSSMI